MEESIEVRYHWTREEQAAAYELLPVHAACLRLAEPWWLSLIGPLILLLLNGVLIGVLVLANALGGGWGVLGVLFTLILGFVLLLGRGFYQRRRYRRALATQGNVSEWRFRVTESTIEWWVADRLAYATGWGEVVRCHRGEKGFLLCLGDLLPIWLPTLGFSNPEAVRTFARIARRKARTYTEEEGLNVPGGGGGPQGSPA
jgi:hypothetical protein